LKLNILGSYTYVQETIIQAVHKNLIIEEIPVTFRKREGKSKLIKSLFSYIKEVGIAILKTYRDYHPLKTFTLIGLFFITVGFLFGLRVLIHYFRTGYVSPYMPSAILATLMLIIGLLIVILGIIADMIKSSRELTEELLYKVKSEK